MKPRLSHDDAVAALRNMVNDSIERSNARLHCLAALLDKYFDVDWSRSVYVDARAALDDLIAARDA